MSIIASELQWFKSQTVNDTTANGGRMSSVLSPTQVKNNIFPDVTQAERTSGITRLRKMFIKVSNDDDLTLFSARPFVESRTPGEDSVTLFPGTQNDTEADLTGTERLYGSGQLNANISIGATSITVLTEGAALDYFKDGDTIRISNMDSVDDGAGTQEFIAISGAPTYSGDIATINLASATANAYDAVDTKVASVLPQQDVATEATGVTVVSSGGSYDDTTYPVIGDNLGTVEQDWTLTFTSATAFDIVGDTLGNVGSGNVTTDSSPNNPDFSAPYFTLEFAGFSGTFSNGDTLSFTTSPAGYPLWYRQEVPAGANSFTANSVIVGIDGESG